MTMKQWEFKDAPVKLRALAPEGRNTDDFYIVAIPSTDPKFAEDALAMLGNYSPSVLFMGFLGTHSYEKQPHNVWVLPILKASVTVH